LFFNVSFLFLASSSLVLKVNFDPNMQEFYCPNFTWVCLKTGYPEIPWIPPSILRSLFWGYSPFSDTSGRFIKPC
jgi:hypothetical protein